MRPVHFAYMRPVHEILYFLQPLFRADFVLQDVVYQDRERGADFFLPEKFGKKRGGEVAFGGLFHAERGRGEDSPPSDRQPAVGDVAAF